MEKVIDFLLSMQTSNSTLRLWKVLLDNSNWIIINDLNKEVKANYDKLKRDLDKFEKVGIVFKKESIKQSGFHGKAKVRAIKYKLNKEHDFVKLMAQKRKI